MSPKRWHQIEALYHDALQLPSAERAALLNQACAGDDVLRREVEALLHYDEETRGFLNGNALDAAAREIKFSQPKMQITNGQHIGAYTVVAPLGKGGMGEVNRAKDKRLNREVAIKVLPSEFAKNADLLQRFASDYAEFASDWSRDGRYLVFRNIRRETKFDILYLDLSQNAATRKPIAYLQTPANEAVCQLSPDGRWMAYASDESGQHEFYVQSFPQPGSKRQISSAGGFAPSWRGDGKELFYHALDGKLIAVPVNASDTFEMDAPKELFAFRRNNTFSNHYYDVTRDGQRFLLSTIVDPTTPLPLTMVVNWAASAKRE